MKKTRTLGLAVFMVLVFGAFTGVSSASAAAGVYIGEGSIPKFETESYGEIFSGATNTNAISSFNFFGTGSCPKAQVESELPFPTTTLLMAPQFSGCTANGISVTVNTNGCLLRNDLKSSLWGTVRVSFCPEGKGIEFSETVFGGPVCTATVPNGASWLAGYINRGSGSTRYIESPYEAENVEYTLTAKIGGEVCGKPVGTYHDGYMAGHLNIKNQ